MGQSIIVKSPANAPEAQQYLISSLGGEICAVGTLAEGGGHETKGQRRQLASQP